jgi:hypothetical protein
MRLREPARDALSICLEYAKGPAHAELRGRAQALQDLTERVAGVAATTTRQED